MHSFYGELAGLRIARKHVLAYLQHLGLAEHGKAFLQVNDAHEQLDWLLQMSRWDQQARDAA
jgi:hypothetical protein